MNRYLRLSLQRAGRDALNIAENPRTRLCALCGCAAELTPMLSGVDHITGS